MTPSTSSGVPSSLYSGWLPKLSVLNRQATSRSLKFEALIWSSGSYRLPEVSAKYWVQLTLRGVPGAVWRGADATPRTTVAARAEPRIQLIVLDLMPGVSFAGSG